jgi:xylose isomerase
MRSYLILKDKVARFHADPEIKQILATLEKRSTSSVGDAGLGPVFKYDKKTAAALKAHIFDATAMAAVGYEYERLDQLTTEVLLGVR